MALWIDAVSRGIQGKVNVDACLSAHWEADELLLYAPGADIIPLSGEQAQLVWSHIQARTLQPLSIPLHVTTNADISPAGADEGVWG